ncbi:MAG: DUF302 domain-containing protein [Chitinivibrionales bacterium]|nr:DUF302 domain-containing protein [Chitinivibrionales bacterium]
MAYYYSKTISGSFNEIIQRVTDALKKEGFGILTRIDISKTLKEKLNVDFRNYTILGACNPPFAYKALQAEDNIGVMLPCNVIVQEKEMGKIEVASIEPQTSMQAVKNPSLESIAVEIQSKLHAAIDSLQ